MLDSLGNVVENYPRRETDREYSAPFVTVILFSIPPLLILLATREWVPLVVVRIPAVAVVLVTVAHVFWIKGYHADDFDPKQFDLEEASRVLEETVWTNAGNASDDVQLTEYRQVSRAIESHDALAIRASYFSLATLGILASVFFTISKPIFQPFVALFAMSIAFAFHVVVEKNVILRDTLRRRQLELERHDGLGQLTTGRTREIVTEYGQYPSANLGTQLVDFNKFWLYAWVFGYHVSTIYVAFLVVG